MKIKTFTTYLVLYAILATHPIASAECLYPLPRYTSMKIESCTSATEMALAAIEGKAYSAYELSAVRVSADRISIIRAVPVADVDIIIWHFDGNRRIFMGETRRIAAPALREYILVATDPDECKRNYVGKTVIVEPYTGRCNDTIVGGINETDASALLKLPELQRFWGEEELENAPKRLLDALR